MSSILEALKKLEAEKNAQQIAVETPEPAYTSNQMAQNLLGNYSDPSPATRRLSPALLVLGGSLFTMLFIAITVSIAVMVLGNVQAPPAAVATAPGASSSAEPASNVVEQPAMVAALVPEAQSAQEHPAIDTPPASEKAPQESTSAAVVPKASPKPRPAPEPAAEPYENSVVTPVPVVTEARYEPYIPKPAASKERASAPVPDDIRTLPMLTRSERSQYRLDALTINMLNEASATRPLGNALINLEKIFIGETLPGSNATLIDVKSHGIAIEIMSTGQRYYIPR